MSSWGNLDNVLLKGNVSSATTRDYLDGFQTNFESNIKPGDYIVFAGNKYQVANVTSDVKLHLTSLAATNSSNVDAFAQQGPKYVGNVSFPANNVSIQNIIGVDRVEIGIPENKARGVSTHTGWTHYTTYTDALSQTRNKSEVLVAMSKNFSANATGFLFADTGSFDADDDTTAADYLIYFTSQPSNVTDYLANLGSATFVVVADSDPTGATITYQWQRAANTIDATSGYFTNLSNAGVILGATSATLELSNVSGLNGNVFRCVISGSGGADSNTSEQARITIL